MPGTAQPRLRMKLRCGLRQTFVLLQRGLALFALTSAAAAPMQFSRSLGGTIGTAFAAGLPPAGPRHNGLCDVPGR
jgi:hypothetical protein